MTDKEKIRAEIEREMGDITYGVGKPKGVYDFCKELLCFIDSLPEETDAVEGVVSYLVGADQAAIKYKDPSGIFMSYYAKRDGLGVGDKVKIIVIKE